MLKRIHINQHNIKHNRKELNDLLPPISVKCGKQIYYGFRVKVENDSEVVYKPHKPLSCGATVWIETVGKVFLYDINDNLILDC